MTERVITFANGGILIFADDKIDTTMEPAKRWTNEWMAMDISSRCSVCGAVRKFAIGERFLNHCAIWPSYDIALTKGLEFQPHTQHRYMRPVPVE